MSGTLQITAEQIARTKHFINDVLPKAGMTGNISDKVSAFVLLNANVNSFADLTQDDMDETLGLFAALEPSLLVKHIEASLQLQQEVRGAAPNAPAEQPQTSERPPQGETFVDALPHVPATMKAQRQWVRWQLETVNGKPTKIPYQVNGQKASSTDPNTWTDYRTAVTGAIINHERGVGFMFANGFAGVDLDGCRNPQTGDIAEWAEDILASFGGAYTEVSPSGRGLHAIVLGKVPGTTKKFNLNPAIGDGKAAIEIYDSSRYFTITGKPQFKEVGEVLPCDLTEVYNKAHALRAANPAPRSERAAAADSSDGTTTIEKLGDFNTTKYDIFTSGVIESTGDHKPFIISDRYGRLTYPGFSEADQGFMNVSAYVNDGDTDKMWDDYVNSPLARNKWLNREADFRRNTIAKAVKWFEEKNLTPYTSQPAQTTQAAVVQPPAESAAPVVSADATGLEESDIPPYNPAIECGFFKEVVDAVCNGTTIPRQFMHNALKTFVGAVASKQLKFESLDCNSCIYGVNIGTSGTSKRTVWERGIVGIFSPIIVGLGDGNLIKVYESVDSGAGLRDAFFDAPKEAPVLVVIDEAASLGNKSAETKNPEIVDAIIELADSTVVSRVKASKSIKRKSAKTHNDARLSMYMCAQEGVVVTQAFAGRKKQGINERLSIEYSPAIEPGKLLAIPVATKVALADKLVKLINPTNWVNPIKMAPEAEEFVEAYWNQQPKEVRQKVRLCKNLWLDIYMRAFSRGEHAATIEDARLCCEHFERDKVIRKVQFRGEISNKVGLYVEHLKQITEAMRTQLNKGLDPGAVALSRRDLQTRTHAYDDNELDFFDRALNVFGKAHLLQVKVKAANGQEYTKFIPMPHEDENWNLLPNSTQEFKP